VLQSTCKDIAPKRRGLATRRVCIARDRGLTLITEDKKLRNTARRGGIEPFDTSETLESYVTAITPL
jgi:hypothetical protein